MSLDPVVHAALVTVFVFLVRLLCNTFGFDVTESTYYEIAGLIVAYILSLFGYATYKGLINKSRGVNASTDNQYVPPFTA